jgi:hypothetical protein
MRAVARRNEHDLIEPDVVADRFGNEEMPVVNRVEAAPENTDVNAPSIR